MNSEIVIYQKEGEAVEVQLDSRRDTVWLSQVQMAELFEKDSDTIGLHLKNIYKSGELEEDSTTEQSSVVPRKANAKLNVK